MKIDNISLPYPVLGNSDDILPLLTDDCISVAPEAAGDDFVFHVSLKLGNEDIESEIAAGNAEYVCEVTCPRTYMRRGVASAQADFDVVFGRRDVFGGVDFACYAIVKNEIPEYFNHGQNEDYGDATFHMEPGDILAAFPVQHWNADLKYEKLYAAGSFMLVQDGGDKPTWFDSNDDHIIVYLPHDMYEQFRLLSPDNNFNEIFHASIVFNALFKTLAQYDESRDGHYQWAEAIKYRINSEEEFSDFDIMDTAHAYELAEALLKDPYRRLFNHLKDIMEE